MREKAAEQPRPGVKFKSYRPFDPPQRGAVRDAIDLFLPKKKEEEGMPRHRVVAAVVLAAVSVAPIGALAMDRTQPVGSGPVMATPIEIPKIDPVSPVVAMPIEIPKIAPILATPIEIPGDGTSRAVPTCDPTDPTCEDDQ